MLVAMGGGTPGHTPLSFPGPTSAADGSAPHDPVIHVLAQQNTLLLSPEVWQGGNLHVLQGLACGGGAATQDATAVTVSLSASAVHASQQWLLRRMLQLVSRAQALSKHKGARGVLTPQVLQQAAAMPHLT